MEGSIEASQTEGGLKPKLAPKPRLTPKPFSLQQNTTIRSIYAPKTITSLSKATTHQTGKSEALGVPKATLTTPAQTPPQQPPTSDSKLGSVSVHAKDQPKTTEEKKTCPHGEDTLNSSVAPRKTDPASQSSPPKKARSKSEPIQKEDVTQRDHNTSTDVVTNSEQKDKKKKEDETQMPVVQKLEESGGDDSPTANPKNRWGGDRKRLSSELTSKFESGGLSLPPQPTITISTPTSKDDANQPVPPNPEQSPTTSEPPNRERDEGKLTEEYSGGGSIKRRISLLFDSSSRPEVVVKREEPEIVNGAGAVKERIKNWRVETGSEGLKNEKKPQVVPRIRAKSFDPGTALSAEKTPPKKPPVKLPGTVTSPTEATDPPKLSETSPETSGKRKQRKSKEGDVQLRARSHTVAGEGSSAASEKVLHAPKGNSIRRRSVHFGVVERDDGGPPVVLRPETESNAEDKAPKDGKDLPVYRRVGILQNKDEEVQKKEEERLKHLEFEKRRKAEESLKEKERLMLEEEKKQKEEEKARQMREEEKRREEEKEREKLKEKEKERQRKEELERERLKEEERERERLREEEIEKERQMELMWQRQREEERERAKQKEEILKQEQEERLKEEERKEERLKEERERQRRREDEEKKKEEELELMRQRQKKEDEEKARQKEERLRQEEREKERLREEERKKEEELELMRQRQKEEDEEKARQKEERLKQEEREKERLREEERKKEEELELMRQRQKEEDEEKARQKEERLRQEEREKERLREEERKREEELELMRQRQKEEDEEKARQKEERLRQEEREKERLREEERKREEELELMRQRQKEEDEEKARQKEERLRQEEREKERLREEERKKEEERMRERQREVEEEERRKMELERKKQQEKEEKEKMRQIEMERQREEERKRRMEKEKAEELERKRQEELEELERKRAEEVEEKLRMEREREQLMQTNFGKEEDEEREMSVDEPEITLISFDSEPQTPSGQTHEPTLEVVYDDFSVRKPQFEVDFDDFSVKPKRWGSQAKAETNPVQTTFLDEEVEMLVDLEDKSQERNVREQVEKPDSPEPTPAQEKEEEKEEEEKKEMEKEEEVDTKEDKREEDDKQKTQLNSYRTGGEDKDTDALIDGEPDLQNGACEPTPESDSPKPAADQPPEVSSEDVDVTDFQREPELSPFPESTTPLLDTSAQKSKADLGKRRIRTRPSRSLRAGLTETDGKDWKFCDSTDEKPSKRKESESEEEQPKPKIVCSPPPTSQRVPIFPGLNPAALIAQLKKRTGGGGEETEDKGRQEKEIPNEEVLTSPTQMSRSPRSAAHLAGAARVLPPIGGTDGGPTSSPAWLKELKSKKRLSQHEGDV